MSKTLLAWSVLLLAPAALAQVHAYTEADVTGVMSYERVDGERIRGEVLGVEGERARIKVELEPGTMVREYKLDEFKPPSVYVIRLVAAGADPAKHLDLARYALQIGQTAAARRSLATARQLAGDPTLGADVEKALVAAPAMELERTFHTQLDRGDVRGAESSLQKLRSRYSDLVPASRLAELDAELQQRKKQRDAEIVAEKADQASKREVAERERKLAPLQKRLERASAARQRGLESSKSFSTALDLFNTASRECSQVLREVASLKQSAGNDPVMMRELTLLADQAKSIEVDSLLSSASLHTTRGNYNAAMGEVNKVLAVDPGNTQALATRGRIELASSQGWGSGWGW